MADVDEAQFESANILRPRTLAEFVSQDDLRANLSVMIKSARTRDDVLEHILLSGPPGTGKTSLAHIIATEMGGTVKTVHAPTISKPKDLIQSITQIRRGDVLFIDEIHRLPPAAEELLYPVMEDYRLQIMIGSETQARAVDIELPRFTVVAATTRKGMLSPPLYMRFGSDLVLSYYDVASLARLVSAKAEVLDVALTPEAAEEIALRARGTPRIALQLLRRVRDFAVAAEAGAVSGAFAAEACLATGVDRRGLTAEDRAYLSTLRDRFRGRPAGLSTLAAMLSQDEETVESAIEPFLLQLGLIERTPRGRCLTTTGFMAAQEALEL